jgi:hypothetical protein
MNESSRHVQTTVPALVHRALHDLSYETGRSVGDLVADGVLLLLRWHDRGHDLPQPAPPLASSPKGGTR